MIRDRLGKTASQGGIWTAHQIQDQWARGMRSEQIGVYEGGALIDVKIGNDNPEFADVAYMRFRVNVSVISHPTTHAQIKRAEQARWCDEECQ